MNGLQAGLVVIAILAAGCGDDPVAQPRVAPSPVQVTEDVTPSVTPEPSPVEPSPEPTVSPTPTPEEEEEEIVEETLPPEPPEYLAVFATAPEPGGVQPYRKGLVEAAGDNEWFGTVDCWKGLGARLGVAKDRWAVGITASSSGELDSYVDRYGRSPILSDLFKHTLHCSASS